MVDGLNLDLSTLHKDAVALFPFKKYNDYNNVVRYGGGLSSFKSSPYNQFLRLRDYFFTDQLYTYAWRPVKALRENYDAAVAAGANASELGFNDDMMYEGMELLRRVWSQQPHMKRLIFPSTPTSKANEPPPPLSLVTIYHSLNSAAVPGPRTPAISLPGAPVPGAIVPETAQEVAVRRMKDTLTALMKKGQGAKTWNELARLRKAVGGWLKERHMMDNNNMPVWTADDLGKFAVAAQEALAEIDSRMAKASKTQQEAAPGASGDNTGYGRPSSASGSGSLPQGSASRGRSGGRGSTQAGQSSQSRERTPAGFDPDIRRSMNKLGHRI